MKYLLDTNIYIYLIRHKPAQVVERFNQHEAGEIGISSITVGELWYGVEKSQRPEQNGPALIHFLLPLEIAFFDERAAMSYGKVRAALERQGTPIGSLDTLIAAHTMSLEAVLVTNNAREFERIPGLEVVNWAE